MKRKSVSIKNAKIINYIEEVSSKLNVSESFFVESILEDKIKKDIIINKSNHKKNRTLLSSIIMQGEKPIILSKSHNNGTYRINLNSFGLITPNNEIDRRNVIKQIHSYFLNNINSIDIFHLSEKGINSDDFIMLSLFKISEIKIINGINEPKRIKELKELHKLAISRIDHHNKDADTLWKNIQNSFLNLENKITEILNEQSFHLEIEVEGWTLPIIIDDQLNSSHHFYDYLNVKYLSYRSLKESLEYKMDFILLLNGNYGFFYCDIFDHPKDSAFFKSKLNELKNKNYNRKNLSTFINENHIIKFTPEYPAIKKSSKLLKKIIEIKRQKFGMTKNLMASAFTPATKNTSKSKNINPTFPDD